MSSTAATPSAEADPDTVSAQYPVGPSQLDALVYRDPDRYRREMERIFFRSWMPVAPSTDLRSAGDYVVWDRLAQSVVIARQEDGSVAAWHNVCQHRGARLVEADGRCQNKRFICPWHGFSYDLRGRVTGVPLRETFDDRALDGLAAPPVRTGEWAGWIWLTLGADAPSLESYLGDVGGELGWYGARDFTVRNRTAVRLPVNWKVVVDAFNETWHVPFTHANTLSRIVMWRDASLKLAPPHSWMTLPLRGFTDVAGADTADHHEAYLCHYLTFPNTIFSCFPTHLHMWTAWPISLEETELCAYEMVGPPPAGMTTEAWSRASDRNWQHFLDVLAEDSKVIIDLATVSHSLGFRRNMFNAAEGRLTSFHQEVDRCLRAGGEQ